MIMMNSRPLYTNSCCIFWENIFQVNIDWPNVFKRYFIFTKENKLRQFNFKLIYNLLPVRKNLLKWNLINEGHCSHCRVEEDVIHAFFTCKLNSLFFTYIENIIKQVYRVDMKINSTFLIESDFEDFDILVIIAFWTIYKLLLERNRTGTDKRTIGLKCLFAREIENRIEINEASKTKMYNFPKEILYCF